MHPMHYIGEFITLNQNLIYFIYGLVYFLMGFAILLQCRDYSTLKIARHLPLLGGFGITHGLADWAHLFIPWQTQIFSPPVISMLWYIYLGLLTTSFLFLFSFGLNLTAHHFNFPWMRLIPGLLSLLWLSVFLFSSRTVNDPVQWRLFGSTWSRYLLAFPAALLTTYGLYGQFRELNRLGFFRVARYLWGALILFALYGILAGLIVPEASFFPANILNYTNFEKALGIPIQPFRTLTGVGIAYFVIRYLEIFHMEMRRRLEDAERQQTVLEERERISRDIHDGTLQSLYGIGLRLEHCRYLLQDIPSHAAQPHLNYCVNKLNSTITEIRGYISGFHTQLENKKFRDSIEKLSEEFLMNTGVLTNVIYEENTGKELEAEEQEHIYLIMKEALNNIAKHAHASAVEIKVIITATYLDIVIGDNGCGFECNRTLEAPDREMKGQGLCNMESRVRLLGGEFRVVSAPECGTQIQVKIPLAKGEGQDGSFESAVG